MIAEFVGIPFKDGDPSFGGANCITLIELFYERELSIQIPIIRIEAKNSRRAFMQFLTEISERWDEVFEPELYDVVAFCHDPHHPNVVQHFGIYLGHGKILHTLEKIGSHITTVDRVQPFIRGYYRWRS